jgi:hypothetical protein
VSDYTKTTNFTAKDSLSTGDADKIIKGALHDDEFDAIAVAVATKANLASPTFTGTVILAALTASGAVSIDSTTDTSSGTTGSIHTDGGVGIAKKLFVGTTSTLTGVTTHGGNVVSDTDSTDDLGTTSVRWANTWSDTVTGTTLNAGTLALAAGSITDSSGAISFGNENLTTTGNFTAANIITAGNVDGRDVSTDGTKLDGIEAAADVTDATNVTAAGALMDSELAGIAAVKATTGTFLSADESKLDGIEASADVTDATNVTAAGALMDSELAGIAAVKATTGTFLSADESKLDGIEASADVTDEANVTDALDGATLTAATVAVGDKVLIQDINDSNILKTVTTQAIANLGGGGAKVFIAAASASSDATIDFTSNIDSTYDEYELHLLNVIPVTDSVSMYLRTSTNASSFDSGASDYRWDFYNINNSSLGGGIDVSDAQITLATYVGSSANELGVSAVIKLYRPSEATYSVITWLGSKMDTNGAPNSIGGQAWRLATEDVNGIQVLFSSGNVESGLFALYGIKRS